ncbi:hypothetical protein M0804_013277 [Polistes exclamans]|nr:hypothetical protein M0804_013277 [Polistes exclamans]
MMDNSMLKKIQEVTYPSEPSEFSYNVLITMLVNSCSDYTGKEVPIYRYLFRKQLPYESIDHYVIALKKLYSKCTPDFQNSINVVKRFTEGLSHEETKNLLSQDKDLSFPTAIAIAKQMEYAENQKSKE